MSSSSKDDVPKSLGLFESHLCKKSSEGEWVVDKVKLAAVVESEGVSFVDATAALDFQFQTPTLDSSDSDYTKAPVFLLNKSQVHTSKTYHYHDVNVIVWLFRGQIPAGVFGTTAKAIDELTTRWQIAKWIRGDDAADKCCVVCYQTIGISLENTSVICDCGNAVCFGCCIGMFLITDTKMAWECPNCRKKTEPIDNFMLIISGIKQTLRNGHLLGEVSAEHTAFIELMTGIDLTLPRKRVLEQTNRIDSFFDSVIKSKCERMEMYKEMRQFVDGMRKTKVVRASAEDSSSAVAVRSRFGCANCGKQFWDKSDWRRAPKCTKCRRTAYCSAKCRKAHRRAHADHCTAKKKKAKRKVKKKKPKKGCAPF